MGTLNPLVNPSKWTNHLARDDIHPIWRSQILPTHLPLRTLLNPALLLHVRLLASGAFRRLSSVPISLHQSVSPDRQGKKWNDKYDSLPCCARYFRSKWLESALFFVTPLPDSQDPFSKSARHSATDRLRSLDASSQRHRANRFANEFIRSVHRVTSVFLTEPKSLGSLGKSTHSPQFRSASTPHLEQVLQSLDSNFSRSTAESRLCPVRREAPSKFKRQMMPSPKRLYLSYSRLLAYRAEQTPTRCKPSWIAAGELLTEPKPPPPTPMRLNSLGVGMADPQNNCFDLLRCTWIDMAAVMIQRNVRRVLSKKCVALMKAQIEFRSDATKAAVCVQRHWRGSLARYARDVIKHSNEIMEQRRVSSIRIQRWWRYCRSRDELTVLILASVRVRQRTWAATLIQRMYRGHRCRRILDEDHMCWVLRWPWSKPGAVVEVVGDFTNPAWTIRRKLQWDPFRECFVVVLPRRAGRFEIKFVIDGKYGCDGSFCVVDDGAGCFNNIMDVSAGIHPLYQALLRVRRIVTEYKMRYRLQRLQETFVPVKRLEPIGEEDLSTPPRALDFQRNAIEDNVSVNDAEIHSEFPLNSHPMWSCGDVPLASRDKRNYFSRQKIESPPVDASEYRKWNQFTTGVVEDSCMSSLDVLDGMARSRISFEHRVALDKMSDLADAAQREAIGEALALLGLDSPTFAHSNFLVLEQDDATTVGQSSVVEESMPALYLGNATHSIQNTSRLDSQTTDLEVDGQLELSQKGTSTDTAPTQPSTMIDATWQDDGQGSKHLEPDSRQVDVSQILVANAGFYSTQTIAASEESLHADSMLEKDLSDSIDVKSAILSFRRSASTIVDAHFESVISDIFDQELPVSQMPITDATIRHQQQVFPADFAVHSKRRRRKRSKKYAAADMSESISVHQLITHSTSTPIKSQSLSNSPVESETSTPPPQLIVTEKIKRRNRRRKRNKRPIATFPSDNPPNSPEQLLCSLAVQSLDPPTNSQVPRTSPRRQVKSPDPYSQAFKSQASVCPVDHASGSTRRAPASQGHGELSLQSQAARFVDSCGESDEGLCQPLENIVEPQPHRPSVQCVTPPTRFGKDPELFREVPRLPLCLPVRGQSPSSSTGLFFECSKAVSRVDCREPILICPDGLEPIAASSDGALISLCSSPASSGGSLVSDASGGPSPFYSVQEYPMSPTPPTAYASCQTSSPTSFEQSASTSPITTTRIQGSSPNIECATRIERCRSILIECAIRESESIRPLPSEMAPLECCEVPSNSQIASEGHIETVDSTPTAGAAVAIVDGVPIRKRRRKRPSRSGTGMDQTTL